MNRPPDATPKNSENSYMLERRLLNGVPCLFEHPFSDIRGVVLVFHGAGSSKEANIGVFTPLIDEGFVVVYPDAALHGELKDDNMTPETVGERNYVWLAAARTTERAPELLSAVSALFSGKPLAVVGMSMGGYTAQTLAMTDERVGAAVVISSDGFWSEAEVTEEEALTFMRQHRPSENPNKLPPTRLFLLHGEADEVFSLENSDTLADLYRNAYRAAGVVEAFEYKTYSGVEHATSEAMRDDAVAFIVRSLI